MGDTMSITQSITDITDDDNLDEGLYDDDETEEIEQEGGNKKIEIRNIGGFEVKYIDGCAILRSGNKDPIKVKTELGIWLEGGGGCASGREKFFKKKSGGGDFVKITHHTRYLTLPVEVKKGYNSFTILSISSREEANSSYVMDVLMNADAIWIDGGKQSLYYQYWVGTNVVKGINFAVNEKGIPIGGTSAGMAVLTQFSYCALVKPRTRKLLPKNERNPVRNFLNIPLMRNKYCDQHVLQRKRYTRLQKALAQIIYRRWVSQPQDLVGIGCNERSALRVDENEVGTCCASGGRGRLVYIYRPKCVPKYGHSFEGNRSDFMWLNPGIEVITLRHGDTYDFRSGQTSSSDISLYEYRGSSSGGYTYVDGMQI